MKTNKIGCFICGVLATYGLVVAFGNMGGGDSCWSRCNQVQKGGVQEGNEYSGGTMGKNVLKIGGASWKRINEGGFENIQKDKLCEEIGKYINDEYSFDMSRIGEFCENFIENNVSEMEETFLNKGGCRRSDGCAVIKLEKGNTENSLSCRVWVFSKLE